MRTSRHRFEWLQVVAVLFLSLLTACGVGGGASEDTADPLAIGPAQLPSGTTGTYYATTLFGSGGTESGYAWDLVVGALPPNLGGLPWAGAAVTLSGVLGAPGTYDFTVRLRDSDANLVTRSLSVTILPTGGTGPNHPTSLVGAPSVRGGHTAVWTGTEMIIWGGLQMTGLLSDGAAYDPATDSWRTIASAGAPAGRFAHTAIWSGTEMIVWGGWDAQGALANGGAYDPIQDTWRALPAASAPQARAIHTAVWTGSTMIVWGGQGVFPPPAPNSVDLVFGDGGAYDPVAHTWSPATPGGPAARNHTAVWTGTRMITWGGRDSFALAVSVLNDGGVHDPAAGTWTATTNTGAPTARLSHTAVAAGATGMIVWGGFVAVGSPVATGGRYQPSSNTWAATSQSGAATPRAQHTAVWTGTEMVVWGGVTNLGALLGDGAAYDPTGNTWRPLAAGYQPQARAEHTAVWTGTAMIVWGGRTSPADTHLATGAVIVP